MNIGVALGLKGQIRALFYNFNWGEKYALNIKIQLKLN